MKASRASSQLGADGERMAQVFLERHGYRFVDRNWHCAAGELDLVMLDGDELVFVEVKTRRGERSGRAEDAVSPAKAARLLAAAEWYLSVHAIHQDRVWRCDLVAITTSGVQHSPRIDHYVNAIVSG